MLSTVLESAADVLLQLPTPDGPDAPQEVKDSVNRGLTLVWFALLGGCFAMAMVGIGSMAFYKRKERYDEANAGVSLAGYAVAGAVGIGLLGPVFAFMGIV